MALFSESKFPLCYYSHTYFCILKSPWHSFEKNPKYHAKYQRESGGGKKKKELSRGKPPIYQLSTKVQTPWPYGPLTHDLIVPLWPDLELLSHKKRSPSLLWNMTSCTTLVMPGLLLLHTFPFLCISLPFHLHHIFIVRISFISAKFMC